MGAGYRTAAPRLLITYIAPVRFDEFVNSPKIALDVLPAEAGIQYYQAVLDSGFRRSDMAGDFLRARQL